MSSVSVTRSSDFIRDIVDEDIRSGKYGGKVITRFPPEPNGYLHIGHAKSICLNFGIAKDYGGACHLRMDDTDPTKENTEYVEAIQQDVRWLGFDWGEKMFYASDYFPQLYEFAVQLIQDGLAYVDSQNEQEIRENRGTVTQAGKNSPYRERSVEENLDLFARMKKGEFENGAHILRGKIDMANPNMKMRDPLLYRIRHAHHYRTGNEWCIYPMYDFAHPVSDALEGITYSICTLEFENNRELYDWVLDACGFEKPRSQQYEFARLNLNYTVMSKRKLLQLVEEKHVSGWDDPRMYTISGLRRRGYTPEALRKFCETIGVAKANSTVDMAQLEHAIRDDLNTTVPRVLCVLRPLKVVITNYDGPGESLEGFYYPHDVPLEGSRAIPFTREIYIERDDFMEDPPKGYHRLSPGAEVRLRHAYIIKCEEVVKDLQGNITELRCTYDPQTRSGDSSAVNKKVGTIHWVSASENVPVEVRLYDRLFTVENPEGVENLNPHSLEVLKTCYLEAALKNAEAGSRYQFERQGYFYLDPKSSEPGQLVFNRIVTLKDTWSRQAEAEKPQAAQAKKASAPSQQTQKGTRPQLRELSPEQAAMAERFEKQYQLSAEEANLLASEPDAARFFEEAAPGGHAASVARIVINELMPVLKERELVNLPMRPAQITALAGLIEDETISAKIAKDVFAEMLQSGQEPSTIVEARNWRQISDPTQLEPVIAEVLGANAENVAQYKAGKTSLFGSFVGQVLKKTGGRANPRLVNELLEQKLSQ